MRMTKKILSVVLAVMMVASMMAVMAVTSVSAAGAVAKVGETEYTSLSDALDNVPNGGTVTVLQNISNAGTLYADGYVLGGNRTYTVDLGGYTVSGASFSVADGNDVTFTNGTITSASVAIQNAATTTVDTSATVISTVANNAAVYGLTGSNTIINGTVEGNKYGVFLVDTANGTINGSVSGTSRGLYVKGTGTANVTGTIKSDDRGVTVENGATVNLNNGADVTAPYGVVALKNANVNVSKGASITSSIHAITGNGTSDCSGYTVNINGGTITATGDQAAIYHPNTGELNIFGGEISATVSAIVIKSGTTEISGGTITSETGKAVKYEDGGSSYAALDEISVTGGTFSSDVSEFVDTTTTNVTQNIDGSYSITSDTNYICQVGGNGYSNLNDAVAEAMSSGNAIYLLKDLTTDEKNAYTKPNVEGTFVVYANGFTGYNFAVDSKASTTPYVISWTIKGNSKASYIYTYTIKAATIQVTRANGDVVYPTSLYTALAGMKSSGCAQEGETVKLLADMDFDADKAAIKVSKTNVTLDLNGNDFTAVRENFLEVGNGKTLTVENGTIGGTGNVKVGEGSTLALDNATVEADLAAGADAKLTFANGAQATSIETPDGYEVQSDGNGTSTVVYAPLNPLEKAAADINDGNLFELPGDYLKGTLLGVQKKFTNNINESTSSQDQDGTDNHIRFVAVLDTTLLQSAQDYGFVLAKANTNSDSRKYSNTKFDNLRAYWGNGEKTISAKGTYNNVCGSTDAAMKYGDPTDDSTDYKYITCAVNGMSDDDMVVARFWVKINDTIYYAKYAGHNYKYTGCMTKANLEPVEE